MPYVSQNERSAMAAWLATNNHPPMDERFWVHESHYFEFARRSEPSMLSSILAGFFPTCSGRSLEVGERLEIDWLDHGIQKGTVRSMGSVGFSLELDEPFMGGIPPREVGWIFPSFSSEWRRISEDK